MSGRNRLLNPESFSELLKWLDVDPNRAGEKYEAIRRRLVKFFECHGCRFPEEHSDDTLDRVARRIFEGEAIRASDPYTYIHGVAHHVLKEAWRGLKNSGAAWSDLKRNWSCNNS